MRRTLLYSTFLIALALVVPPSAAQTEVTIEPSKDNSLFESMAGNVSNGVGVYLFAGTTARRSEIRRAVLRFDVAGDVPAGATIDSVKLSMMMTKTISGNHDATLHRLTADWGEGNSDAPGEEGAGGTAATGDVTWLHTFFDTGTWTNPGGDFDATASGTASVGSVGSYTWGSSAGMVADVQAWLDDDASNFGWILVGNESVSGTAKRYDSREGTNPPQLQIFYSLSTAVDDLKDLPSAVSLLSSYPNPFSQSSVVEYTVSDGRAVTLDVYDTLGRRVTTLADGFHGPGTYKARFDAEDLPAGVYFYRIESGDYSRYRQIVLIR
jgi:hypothetical protein